jgi:peptidoglycan hydrolase CwlO-like protein
MTLSFFPLVQSVFGAVVFIIILLLVAAVIGYLTAWFYAKSVYTPIIKKLEEEKADLQKQVAGLEADVRKLNKDIEGLNAKIKGFEKTITEKDNIIEDLRKKIKT